MKVLRYSTILLFGILTLSSAAKTQDDSFRRAWYVGADAGVPFSLSSFSSFAPSGVHGGVRLDFMAATASVPFFRLKRTWDLAAPTLPPRRVVSITTTTSLPTDFFTTPSLSGWTPGVSAISAQGYHTPASD